MKQYLVIGLGSFGTNVVKTLYEAGEEVVAIDSKDEPNEDQYDVLLPGVTFLKDDKPLLPLATI